jgi:hypothetical protein
MISANIELVRERIRRRCASSGRDPADVTLVVVAKTYSSGMIREALGAGARDIGENYVQELVAKRSELEGEEVRWHFVGHLQRNKVRHIVPWIHLIHAVDDASLAAEIDRRAEQASRTIDVLVEVNTTGESSKYGVPPEGVAGLVRSLGGFRNIRVAGLMTMGPMARDPERSRPMFRRLRELRDEMNTLGQDNVLMRHLSMGMTGDFEVAIEEGATLVRIGTAIFGARVRPA